MKQVNRFKDYKLWVALLAFIPILFQSLKVYDINLMLPDNYEILCNSLLGILVLGGIIYAPKDKK